MSQIGIKLTTGALFGGNEPINPLMADRPAWLLLLQPLGDLLRTHAMLEPHREMMAEPCRRLAKLARTRSTSITFMGRRNRSEEHTSELQSLMRISYAVFCLKKKNNII